MVRARRVEADRSHRLAEALAVLGLVDRLRRRPDHFDVIFGEHPHLLEAERAVQRRLAAHGRQQGEAAGDGVALLGDDLGDDLGGDRLDIGPVGHVRVGHDRRRVRIDQDDTIAFLAQRLAGLRPRIIELARLPDDDRAGADDEDGRDVSPLRHDSSGLAAPSLSLAADAFARKPTPSRPKSAGRRGLLRCLGLTPRGLPRGGLQARSLPEIAIRRKGAIPIASRLTDAPRLSKGLSRAISHKPLAGPACRRR